MKKKTLVRSLGCGAAILLFQTFQLLARPAALDQSPQPVLAAMQRVADWQLAHPPTTNRPTGWTQAAGDAGMMALAGISGDAKYRDAMLAMGETNGWKLGPRQFTMPTTIASGRRMRNSICFIASRR